MCTNVAGQSLTCSPLVGEILPALCTPRWEQPAEVTSRRARSHTVLAKHLSPPVLGHPVGCSCKEWLTQPLAGSCPPLFWLHADTVPTKPMSPPALGKRPVTSLHALDARPEQDRGGKGRYRQPRACLEEPTTKSQESMKLPEQCCRRTHLHVGVAGPVLLSHQTFCFHDWKGNETVTPQSSRKGIFLRSSALLHGVLLPCGAKPTSYPLCAPPQQPGLTGHPQTGEGFHCIFFFNIPVL